MLKNVLLSYTIVLCTISCNQKKVAAPPPPITRVNNSFFPVTQFILGQLNELDTLPINPLKITNINGKIDSIWLKREDVRSFAQPFITPVIDSVSCHKYFSGESFLDQTINAFTISYLPVGKLPDSIKLKQWNVYVDPDFNKVKRIFIVKQLNDTKVPQTVQLTWKPDYYCKVITISQPPGKPATVKEEQLIWNFNN